MIQKADPSSREPAPALGVDAGATLTKLVARGEDGALRFSWVPSYAIERVAREVESQAPGRVSLTGGGAVRLAGLLGLDTVPVPEFEAWSRGAQDLLARQGQPPPERDLLVSIGTGTACLLVEAGGGAPGGGESEEPRWVGGSSLGGGTLLGLARLLLDGADHAALVALASRGDRRRVDLLVEDIYQGGPMPLPGHFNASCFGRLANGAETEAPAPEDLAHGLVGLVGDQIALLVANLAGQNQVRRIVFGGTTLAANPPLREILEKLEALGIELVFLEQGGYAGALGALELRFPG